jgi:hypothetical protein
MSSGAASGTANGSGGGTSSTGQAASTGEGGTTSNGASTTGQLPEVDCSNPTFVDAHLEEPVQNAAGTEPLGELTRLTAEAEDIVRLSGIECLTGLVRLELRGNEISHR